MNPIDASRNTVNASWWGLFLACWLGKTVRMRDSVAEYEMRLFRGKTYLVQVFYHDA